MVVASFRSFSSVCQLIHILDDEGNESTRSLGLIVARGTLLVLISPLDGSEQIANPFNNQEEDQVEESQEVLNDKIYEYKDQGNPEHESLETAYIEASHVGFAER